MPEEPNGRLHLPSLSIKGFRGIDELDIPHLGRVTLLTGRNGVGKTTVLEAVRIYASRGSEHVLSSLLWEHEEYAVAVDEDEDRTFAPDLATLFHGRKVSLDSRIEIGQSGKRNLIIKATTPSHPQADLLEKEGLYYDAQSDTSLLAIAVTLSDRERILPLFFSRYYPSMMKRRRLSRRFVEEHGEWPPALKCQPLGPGLLDNNAVAGFWDAVALTEDGDRAVEALNLVLHDNKAAQVAMIGDDPRRYPPRYLPYARALYERRAVVKLQGHDGPVPLKSLGDGAIRLFGVALALAGSRGGFLVIDEAENGIHYSAHTDLWRMILQTARKNDVQVFATTHSFDCVNGFAKAALEDPMSEGRLVRLEKKGGQIRAVAYSEDELKIASEQGIEVR